MSVDRDEMAEISRLSDFTRDLEAELDISFNVAVQSSPGRRRLSRDDSEEGSDFEDNENDFALDALQGELELIDFLDKEGGGGGVTEGSSDTPESGTRMSTPSRSRRSSRKERKTSSMRQMVFSDTASSGVEHFLEILRSTAHSDSNYELATNKESPNEFTTTTISAAAATTTITGTSIQPTTPRGSKTNSYFESPLSLLGADQQDRRHHDASSPFTSRITSSNKIASTSSGNIVTMETLKRNFELEDSYGSSIESSSPRTDSSSRAVSRNETPTNIFNVPVLPPISSSSPLLSLSSSARYFAGSSSPLKRGSSPRGGAATAERGGERGGGGGSALLDRSFDDKVSFEVVKEEEEEEKDAAGAGNGVYNDNSSSSIADVDAASTTNAEGADVAVGQESGTKTCESGTIVGTETPTEELMSSGGVTTNDDESPQSTCTVAISAGTLADVVQDLLTVTATTTTTNEEDGHDYTSREAENENENDSGDNDDHHDVNVEAEASTVTILPTTTSQGSGSGSTEEEEKEEELVNASTTTAAEKNDMPLRLPHTGHPQQSYSSGVDSETKEEEEEEEEDDVAIEAAEEAAAQEEEERQPLFNELISNKSTGANKSKNNKTAADTLLVDDKKTVGEEDTTIDNEDDDEDRDDHGDDLIEFEEGDDNDDDGDDDSHSSVGSDAAYDETGRMVLPPLKPKRRTIPTDNQDNNIDKGEYEKQQDELMGLLEDERVHGDFSLWHSGERLTIDGMKHCYAGLLDNALNTGHFTSVKVLECVIRPDIELKRLMTAIIRIAHTANLHATLLQRSHVTLTPPPSVEEEEEEGGGEGGGGGGGEGGGEGGNRVFESAPAAVTTGRSGRGGGGGVVLGGVSSGSLGAGFDKLDALARRATKEVASRMHKWTGANVEWDQIDVQVCISRELRQRVIIWQFLKRKTGVVLLPGSKQLQLQLQLQGEDRRHKRSASLHTSQIIRTVQRTLTTSMLSLSCLYRVPADKVCPLGGLDPHFKAQLQSLCREAMWVRLRDTFSAMEEHKESVELACATFMATLEPVYKQHGIRMPPPPRRNSISDFPLVLDTHEVGDDDYLSAERIEDVAVKNGDDDSLEISGDDDDGDDDDDDFPINQEILTAAVVSNGSITNPTTPTTSEILLAAGSEAAPVAPSSIGTSSGATSPTRHFTSTRSTGSKASCSFTSPHRPSLKKSLPPPLVPPSQLLDTAAAITAGITATATATANAGTEGNHDILNNTTTTQHKIVVGSYDDTSLNEGDSNLKTLHSEGDSNLIVNHHDNSVQHVYDSTSSSDDGMTKCLVMLHRCVELLNNRCDVEFAARLKQKNEYSVSVITGLCQYKHQLIKHIATRSPKETSQLNKNFYSAFQSVMIVTSLKDVEAPQSLGSRLTGGLLASFRSPSSITKTSSTKTPSSSSTKHGTHTPTDTRSRSTHSPVPVPVTLPNSQRKTSPPPASTPPVSTTAGDDKHTPTSTSKGTRIISGSSGSSGIDSSGHVSGGIRSSLAGQRDVEDPLLCTVVDMLPKPVVVYYCACLVSNFPGFLYVTQALVCLSYGVPGLSSTKEALPLRYLDSVRASVQKNKLGVSVSVVVLSFFAGGKEVVVTPIMVDCSKLQDVLIEAKMVFSGGSEGGHEQTMMMSEDAAK